MFFLIRAIFWLTVVYLLLPVGQDGEPDGKQASASAAETAETVRDTVTTAGDVARFCSGQWEICEAGARLWGLFGGGPEGGPAKGEAAPAGRSALPGDTLTGDDLAPDWDGPVSRQKG